MTTTFKSSLLAAVVLSCAAGAACSQQLTDIVADVSEDTGPWDVTNAQVNGDQLRADVCMAQPDAADTVSDRLLLQLRNKGYQRIDLNMIAVKDGKATAQQVSWSTKQGKQMQAQSPASQNPCATRNAANQPTNELSPPPNNPGREK
jgi:hypothetical protein